MLRKCKWKRFFFFFFFFQEKLEIISLFRCNNYMQQLKRSIERKIKFWKKTKKASRYIAIWLFFLKKRTERKFICRANYRIIRKIKKIGKSEREMRWKRNLKTVISNGFRKLSDWITSIETRSNNLIRTLTPVRIQYSVLRSCFTINLAEQ